MDRASWHRDVDRLMKLRWHIGTIDAGLSSIELARHWRAGAEPAAFVAWFAEKYDLIQFEPDPFRPSRR